MYWLLAVPVLLGLAVFWLKPGYHYYESEQYKSQIRLNGKTVIVTGANRGIGFSTAMDMAQRGAKVILACRNLEKATQSASKIKAKTDNPSVSVMKLDLASFASVRSFVQEFVAKEERLDVLINNAAVVAPDTRQLTVDGNEVQFQTNYLSPFLLTNLLVPLLRKSAPSRIIMLSSMTHRLVFRLPFDNLNSEKSYHSFSNYNQSKLCVILFARHLSELLKGTKVTINAVHPGYIKTNLIESLYNTVGIKMFFSLFVKLIQHFLIGEEEGAQASIALAVDPDLEDTTGKYFYKNKPREPSFLALNSEVARKLWDVSVNLCKLSPEELSYNQ